jgi:cytoskeletal protein RodZ
MTSETYVEELEQRPVGSGHLPWIAAAVCLLLLIAAGVYAWSAHGRATSAEQAVAAVTGERDAATAAAEQARQLATQAEARVQAAETARQDLERQLQAANDNVARLQDELDAKAAEATEAAVSAPPAAAGGAIAVTPAAPLAAEPSGAAPAPAAGPSQTESAAKPESLTITFDVNSSYFPADLSGGLKRLADRLQPGQAYEVELTGAVGSDAASQDENARYNRWLAERRMSRVAEFLQKNAETERLEIKQAFAANDPSRRVVVEVRPLPQ